MLTPEFIARKNENINTGWPLGSNGTMDAVKVHRPRDWASRGDDLGVKHRNTFCTFCHRDRGRFDQVWGPATGLSSGLGGGDTIAAIEVGAFATVIDAGSDFSFLKLAISRCAKSISRQTGTEA